MTRFAGRNLKATKRERRTAEPMKGNFMASWCELDWFRGKERGRERETEGGKRVRRRRGEEREKKTV